MAKGQLATIHYDSTPRPQRSCFANPKSKNVLNVPKALSHHLMMRIAVSWKQVLVFPSFVLKVEHFCVSLKEAFAKLEYELLLFHIVLFLGMFCQYRTK